MELIGELDALRIPQHVHANAETQATHCCGHHAQPAGVIGAALALNRETFRDEDCVRVHPIMTKGGDLVNVVPSEAVLEEVNIRPLQGDTY